MKIKRSELDQLIQEGIWDSLKYYVGKMGSLEKGGKLIGRGEYVEKAKKQFDNTLDKAANVQVKNLVNQIEKEFEEFPNQKDQHEFVNATTAIAAFYDSLKAAVDKYNAGEKEGAMAPEVANGLVEALREYVRILLDSRLADVYKHFTEEQEYDEELFENIFTNWDKKAKELEDEERDGPEDVLKTKQKSATIKGLKSNLFPAALGILGAGSWLAQKYLIDMYEFVGPQGQEELANKVAEISKSPNPDEGWPDINKWVTDKVKAVTDAAQKSGADVSLDTGGGLLRTITPPNGDPKDFFKNINFYADKTNRDPFDIIKMLASQNKNPDFPTSISEPTIKALYQYSNAHPDKFWQAIGNSQVAPSKHFVEFAKNTAKLPENILSILAKKGAMSGSPKAAATILGVGKGGLNISGIPHAITGAVKKAAEKQVKKGVASKVASTATKFGATKAVSALTGSGVFSTLGIGLMAAGAAVKLLRMKGLKSSRAQILNDLEDTLKDFESTGVLAPTEPEKQEEPTKPEAAAEEPGKPEGPSGEEIAQDLEDNPPAKPPAPNVTRLALARLDDDGVKVYIGTRRNKDQRAKEQDLMQAAEEEGVVGRNTDPTTDTLDQEFRKLKKIPDTIKTQYDDIVKRMKGRSAKQPEPYFVVDKSVVSDIKNRLSRLKGKAKKTKISNDAIEKYVEGALKSYIEQDGKMNLRDTTKLITDFIGPKVSTAEKAILQNALVSYGLVKRSKSMPGLKDAAKAAKNKRARERNAAKKQQAQEPQNLQEHKSTLDRWKTLSGILKG